VKGSTIGPISNEHRGPLPLVANLILDLLLPCLIESLLQIPVPKIFRTPK